MKKLLLLLCICFLSHGSTKCCELSPEERIEGFNEGINDLARIMGEDMTYQLVYTEDGDVVLEQTPVHKAAVNLEEKLQDFEEKIEELQRNSESYPVFKESFAIGLLGALSILLSKNDRVGIVLMTVVASTINRVKGYDWYHTIDQLVGTLVGSQLLLFFATNWRSALCGVS